MYTTGLDTQLKQQYAKQDIAVTRSTDTVYGVFFSLTLEKSARQYPYFHIAVGATTTYNFHSNEREKAYVPGRAIQQA